MSAPRLLVANRGEIALRVMRTAERMGYATVAVYADDDRDAPHVAAATEAYALGAEGVAAYLDAAAVLAAAARSGASLIHPGYGFLAENPEFAERCRDGGFTFVGPRPETMRVLGNKAAAKRLLQDRGVGFLPGYHEEEQDDETLAAAARALGFPLMIKAAAGGGGRGMRLVTRAKDFAESLRSARSEARSAFGSGDVLLERALEAPRHVEVQIAGDAHGSVVHLGERDCSVQRRHQKLIEESPSPAVDAALRERLCAAAVAVARAARYVGAGTVEFLLDATGAFYFIEVNARLQVEHAVTEAVCGVDLVEWQIRIARGEPLPLRQDQIAIAGHAVEARLCAEDAGAGFLPQTGTLLCWEPPGGVRVDHALYAGAAVSGRYDSMLAKIVAHGPSREAAVRRLAAALDECVVLGVTTNKRFLAARLRDGAFARGEATTATAFEAAADAAAGDALDPLLLGAAVLYARAVRAGDFGPWASWSNVEPPASTFVLRSGDAIDAVTVRAEGTQLRVTARAGEAVVDVELPSGSAGRFRYRCDGAVRGGAFAVDGATLWLDTPRATVRFDDLTAEPPERRDATPAADGTLRAPMSARVVSVRVRDGERCGAGDVVVVLEAMKMEHSLRLGVAATIANVRVREGGQVGAGEILLTYDAAG